MSRDADVLNALVARLRGAAAAYRRAGADGPGLYDAFAAAADAHARTAEELAAVLRAVGGVPADGPDGLRHAWADLPHAVTMGGRGAAAVVGRIEGELIDALHAARDDAEVSEPVRGALERASDAVKAAQGRTLQRLREAEA